MAKQSTQSLSGVPQTPFDGTPPTPAEHRMLPIVVLEPEAGSCSCGGGCKCGCQSGGSCACGGACGC